MSIPNTMLLHLQDFLNLENDNFKVIDIIFILRSNDEPINFNIDNIIWILSEIKEPILSAQIKNFILRIIYMSLSNYSSELIDFSIEHLTKPKEEKLFKNWIGNSNNSKSTFIRFPSYNY